MPPFDLDLVDADWRTELSEEQLDSLERARERRPKAQAAAEQRVDELATTSVMPAVAGLRPVTARGVRTTGGRA